MSGASNAWSSRGSILRGEGNVDAVPVVGTGRLMVVVVVVLVVVETVEDCAVVAVSGLSLGE